MPVSALSRTCPNPARPALYDAQVASDGLTVDTALGPVDLVAVRRKLTGFDVELTIAELAWIMCRQRGGARRQAAYSLGTDYRGLLRALERSRRDTRTASKAA